MTNQAPAPRLSDQLAERGLSNEQWHTLRNVVWPTAKKNQTVLLAYDYCKARHLDPFKKPVNIVQVFDPDAPKPGGGTGDLVDSIWPSINELRTTAFRTGEYTGKSSVQFGPPVTETFGTGNQAVEVTFPEYAQVVVYRMVAGEPRPFYGDPVFWRETFAAKRGGVPNKMWKERPWGQLAKCAEANALRIGFPEELGNAYTEDEIEGKAVAGAARQSEAPTVPAGGASDYNAGMAGEGQPALENEEPQTVEELTGGTTQALEGETTGVQTATEAQAATGGDQTTADAQAGTGESQAEAAEEAPWEEPGRDQVLEQVRNAESTFALDVLTASVEGDQELKAAFDRRYHELLDQEVVKEEATEEPAAETTAPDAPPEGSSASGFPPFDED